MSTLSPRPNPSSHVPWGIALAAATMLLIGGGAIVWSNQEPAVVDTQESPFIASAATVDGSFLKRELPIAPPSMPLHSVAYSVENGTTVVKIKVIETGDELVVDAATGRLLEARPSRPTAPPPAGRFAAPFQPMT